jgi:hypothetical protein
MQGLPRKVSIILLVLVFGLCVYRARTQFLTVDEALTFRLFVDRELSVMATEFDACNHVLHTLLTKLFRSLFGISEFELRLSSLVGCLVYLIAAYKMSLVAFGSRWTQVLSVAILTLNPLVLDFLVVSRGYGLALGLFLWSLYSATVFWVRGKEGKWLWGSGIAAGLAIAANLTLAIPVAALGIVMMAMSWRFRLAGVWRVIDTYGGSALVVAFLFVTVPLLRARPEKFYYGARTFQEARHYLIQPSFEIWWNQAFGAYTAIERVIVPLLFIAIAGGTAIAAYRFVRAAEPLPFRLVPYLLFGGSLVVSALIVWLMRAFGLPYPMGRTGLYFIPLFSFPLVYGARLLAETRLRRLRWLGYTIALVMVFTYAAEVQTRSFAEWRYDATGLMLRRMQDHYMREWREARQPVLASTDMFRHTVEYYRQRRRMAWLGPLVTDNIQTAEADYYLLGRDHGALAETRGYDVIHQDAVSGMVLAWRHP